MQERELSTHSLHAIHSYKTGGIGRRDDPPISVSTLMIGHVVISVISKIKPIFS
jgi:hypothetical protein